MEDLPLSVAWLACAGPQSALDPAGRDAERITAMTAWLVGGGLLAWVAVVAVGARAVRSARDPRAEQRVVWLGGVVVPTIVLTVVLVATLPPLPRILEVPAHSPVAVHVSGERWWWRVRYTTPEGSFESANELVLPRGRRTPLALVSPDVIHSLWIPSLAGKMDLIPGRTTALALEPTRTGAFRGVCAEYCGASHAHMGLWAVVVEPDAFAAWLAAERADARAPADALAERGARAFLASGCGACHTVRGTPAIGTVGPDLTHVGARRSVAAAELPNDAAAFYAWLHDPRTHKPEVAMPRFDVLGDDTLEALSAYLEGLQ